MWACPGKHVIPAMQRALVHDSLSSTYAGHILNIWQKGAKKSAKISYFSLCDVIDPAASPFSPLITQQSPVGPHTVDISLSLPSFGTEIYSTLWFCSSTHRFLLFSFLFCFVDTLLCLGSLSCCLNKFLPNFSCQTDGFIFASEYFGIQRSLWSTQCLQGTQTTVLDSW